MGCFGKGCLTLVGFLIFLAIAFTGGTFLAVRFLRTSYFSTAPMQLPASTATEEEQQAARANWYDFEHAARAHTARRIELTADQLNALIASEPALRGKAFVTIDNDTARLQISVPLEDLTLFRGRYMNAECTVQSPSDGKPSHARFTSILVNGKPVGDDTLNWTGPWGFRRRIEQWMERDSIKTLQITDGKVILESQGSE
jgi:hypothetical protein